MELAMTSISILIISSLLLLSPPGATAVKEAPGGGGHPNKLTPEAIAAITVPDIKASPEVVTICSRTDNARLCEKTVSLRGVREAGISATSVLLEHLQACAENAALARQECSGAVGAIGEDQKQLAGGYAACTGVYDKATADLDVALSSCGAGDMERTGQMADNAMSYFHSCDDAFEQAQITSPMKETNDFLARLAHNGIVIARAIKDGDLDAK